MEDAALKNQITELNNGIMNFALSLYFIYASYMPIDQAKETVKEQLSILIEFFDKPTTTDTK
jgi:hypothetical protein